MIDLHTHSSASDGDLSPSALIDLAAQAGIGTLALTDHDTISGIAEAEKQAKVHGMNLLPGIETDVAFGPGDFHLLGLGMDRFDPLKDFIKRIRQQRDERNAEMLNKMQTAGLEITPEDLNAAATEVLGRMHFARWMISRKLARDIPDCFERWLGPGCPYYVPKVSPSLEEAAKAVHTSGGKAVLAHPLTLWISRTRLKKNIPVWKEQGLDGIEALHSGASENDARRFTELAEQNGLFITGGSDYHGAGRPDRKIGIGAGGKTLDDSLLEPFK